MRLKSVTTGEVYKYSEVGKTQTPYLQYISDSEGKVKKPAEPFEVKPDFNRFNVFEKIK